MADLNIIANTIEEFGTHLVDVLEYCLDTDMPLRVTAGMDVDAQTATFMYGYFDKKIQILHCLRANFPIGRLIFDISDQVNQQLVDAGKLVTHAWCDGITHRITIPWNGYPHVYYCKLDAIDACLSAIKYGGSLEKIDE